MSKTTAEYYCILQRRGEGDKLLRWKTRPETEKRLQVMLEQFPVPTRFFTQTYALDGNGSPTKLLREETLGIFHGFDLPPPPTRARAGASRKAEWPASKK